MKKFLFVVSLFLMAYSLFAQQEPLMKIYMEDGSTKQYNLKDIDSLGIIKSNSNHVYKIYYEDSLVSYYPVEIIQNIKYISDDKKNQTLSISICGNQKTYSLSTLDSIEFIDMIPAITIGTQVWMLKNLDVDHYQNGDPIPEVRDPKLWKTLKTGAWCYANNDSAIGALYGKLYNWFAVNDPRGLAPEGWHVPDEGEWFTLTYFLGINPGGKLKEAGTAHWPSPNTGATNETGFTALPGGNLLPFDGGFYYVNYIGTWWTSTHRIESQAYAWIRVLVPNSSGITRDKFHKEDGLSVRCVKDN